MSLSPYVKRSLKEHLLSSIYLKYRLNNEINLFNSLLIETRKHYSTLFIDVFIYRGKAYPYEPIGFSTNRRFLPSHLHCKMEEYMKDNEDVKKEQQHIGVLINAFLNQTDNPADYVQHLPECLGAHILSFFRERSIDIGEPSEGEMFTRLNNLSIHYQEYSDIVKHRMMMDLLT